MKINLYDKLGNIRPLLEIISELQQAYKEEDYIDVEELSFTPIIKILGDE